MTTQYQNQPQQFQQPGAQGVPHQPLAQQFVPGQNPQQPGAVGAQQGAGFAQHPQGVHPHAGFAGTTGVAGPHSGMAGTGAGTTVDDSHSGGCFGGSKKTAATGATAGSTAAAQHAQNDVPSGGTKEKIIGAVQYAVGSTLGSEKMKAKGLEKEREGDMLRAQLHETQQQYHRGKGDAHGVVADAFRNQNQPQENQANTAPGTVTNQHPGGAATHGGQLGTNNQNAPHTNQNFAATGAGTGAFAGTEGTMGHGGQLGVDNPDRQAQNQTSTGTQTFPGTQGTMGHGGQLGIDQNQSSTQPQTNQDTSAATQGAMNHGGQFGSNNPNHGDFQNQTQTGNNQPPSYNNLDHNQATDSNKPNMLQKPNPNAGGNVAV